MIETESILVKALSEALEKMAFLAVLPMDEEVVVPVETVLTEISFTGPKNGTLQILTGENFGKILAENIGAVCDADDECCYDALKEIVNVACGLLLPLLDCSSQDVFDVTVPKTFKGQDSPMWREFTVDEKSRTLNVEGYLIAARLTFE